MASHPPPTSNSPDDSAFDYIVVGSGAGGAPLAARLAELGHSVLVIEAGPHPQDAPSGHAVSEVPGLHAQSTEHPEISWQFFVNHYTQPAQPDPKAGRRGIFYPRATGIGGCTIHNAMITVAGPPADWDDLAWYLNDPSWSADVMRGYFRRLEHCEYHQPQPRTRNFWRRFFRGFWWLLGRDDDPTVGRHGFDGWLHTSTADPKLALGDKTLLKMLKAALKASLEAGLEAPSRFITRVIWGSGGEDLDPNHFRRQSERPEGVVLIPTAIHGGKSLPADRGRRSSAARRLLAAANKYPRLRIITDCLVSKVVVVKDGTRQRATAVEYYSAARLYRACIEPRAPEESRTPLTIHAKKEVILCGGAFNTPQLLMLSGIGDRNQLQRVGIETKCHSPGVGRNLQDRYEVTVVTQMKDRFALLKDALFQGPGAAADPALAAWKKDGSGLYGTNGAVLGILKRSRPDLIKPDLFIFGVPLKFLGYQEGYSQVKPEEYDLFTWAILKSHTRNSGGTVTLKSPDPWDTPEINFRFFDDGQATNDPDLEAVVEGVKFVRRIGHHARRAAVGEFYPGLSVQDDADVRAWIQREAWGHHACGTCRMGRRTDPMAVTDSRFRVLDELQDDVAGERVRATIKGLRVVDASIFPSIPGFFLVSNIYMAAEKAADVIHAG